MFYLMKEGKFQHYFSFSFLISHFLNLVFLVRFLILYSGTSKWQEGRISLMKAIWSKSRTNALHVASSSVWGRGGREGMFAQY